MDTTEALIRAAQDRYLKISAELTGEVGNESIAAKKAEAKQRATMAVAAYERLEAQHSEAMAEFTALEAWLVEQKALPPGDEARKGKGNGKA